MSRRDGDQIALGAIERERSSRQLGNRLSDHGQNPLTGKRVGKRAEILGSDPDAGRANTWPDPGGRACSGQSGRDRA